MALSPIAAAYLLFLASVSVSGSSSVTPSITLNRHEYPAQNLQGMTEGSLASALFELIQTNDILGDLIALQSDHPGMVAQFKDARRFAAALPSGLENPQVWTDGDTEVVLEWIKGDWHAVVSFEGGGEFGYAMRQGSQFIPGEQVGNCDRALPSDLLKYIAKI